jgi:parallel beta-helix repeat protein
MKLNILLVIVVLLFCINLINAGVLVPVSRCGAELDSPGYYTTANDSNAPPIYPSSYLNTVACYRINSSDVTLDCAGHNVTNLNTTGNTTGILIEGNSSNPLTNITIMNCQVSNFTWDVYAYYSNNSLILNNTANLSANIAFESHNSSYINFTNNTAYNNHGDGFSSNNSLHDIWDNNTAYNSSFGFVSLGNSAYNTFINNNAHNVTAGFYAYYSYNNTFNNDTAGNNTWGFIADTGSTGNNFTNCTAYGSYWHGFLAEYGANNNLFADDTSHDNSFEGFYMYNSTLNTLINNIAYSNREDGFLVGNSSNNIVLINNTAHDNRYSGFELDNSNYNNLTGNLYNQSPYHTGLLRYGDGFYLYNSSYNNLENNTALNSYIAGFYLYKDSDYNSFINNTAINNSWEGFIIDSSLNNSFTNNFAYANPQFGFEIYLSSGNNITDNTLQESGEFDLYIDSLSWSNFLNFTQSSTAFCNNIIQNITGSGGRPINYSNTSVNWNGITASEIVLCHADDSNLTNVTIRGSDFMQNNGLVISSTSNTVVDSSNSSRNLVGFAALLSTNNNFTNNIANENLFAGFADIIGAGNKFANNLESGSIDSGFLLFFSNNSVYTNNTAHGNNMAGFAIIEGSSNNNLINNTIYNTSQVGTILQLSNLTTITGDHYYNNDVDFAVSNNESFSIDSTAALLETQHAPINGMNRLRTEVVLPSWSTILNLSGVIFDNPAGNFSDYTNLSINDVVQFGDSYAINWSSQPAPPPFLQSPFWNKFINIRTSPGVSLDNLVWYWTVGEATGHNETELQIMQ